MTAKTTFSTTRAALRAAVTSARKATVATTKRAAVDGFKGALDDAMAGLGEYQGLLLLRKLNASMAELKTTETAKGRK
jgi:hypothetical protein